MQKLSAKIDQILAEWKIHLHYNLTFIMLLNKVLSKKQRTARNLYERKILDLVKVISVPVIDRKLREKTKKYIKIKYQYANFIVQSTN